jgi:hypothetical protein
MKFILPTIILALGFSSCGNTATPDSNPEQVTGKSRVCSATISADTDPSYQFSYQFVEPRGSAAKQGLRIQITMIKNKVKKTWQLTVPYQDILVAASKSNGHPNCLYYSDNTNPSPGKKSFIAIANNCSGSGYPLPDSTNSWWIRHNDTNGAAGGFHMSSLMTCK